MSLILYFFVIPLSVYVFISSPTELCHVYLPHDTSDSQSWTLSYLRTLVQSMVYSTTSICLTHIHGMTQQRTVTKYMKRQANKLTQNV